MLNVKLSKRSEMYKQVKKNGASNLHLTQVLDLQRHPGEKAYSLRLAERDSWVHRLPIVKARISGSYDRLAGVLGEAYGDMVSDSIPSKRLLLLDPTHLQTRNSSPPSTSSMFTRTLAFPSTTFSTRSQSLLLIETECSSCKIKSLSCKDDR